MKHLLLLTSLLLVFSCAGDKTKKEVTNIGMEKLIDSVSYAVGLDIANRLELEYKDIDYQMLNQGIEDHFVEMICFFLIRNEKLLFSIIMKKLFQNTEWTWKKRISRKG